MSKASRGVIYFFSPGRSNNEKCSWWSIEKSAFLKHTYIGEKKKRTRSSQVYASHEEFWSVVGGGHGHCCRLVVHRRIARKILIVLYLLFVHITCAIHIYIYKNTCDDGTSMLGHSHHVRAKSFLTGKSSTWSTISGRDATIIGFINGQIRSGRGDLAYMCT